MTSVIHKLILLASLGFIIAASPVGAAEPASGTKSPKTQTSESSLGARALEAILPTSLQKRPSIRFNAFTEMTEEGRKRRQPTSENPMYYSMHEAKFMQMGWMVAAGERPPPVPELETGMRKALATNGYLPVQDAGQRTEILLVLNFGSHGTDPATALPPEVDDMPVTAGELVKIVVSDPAIFKDVISRATLVAGEKFAKELKTSLDGEVSNIRQNQVFARAGNPMLLPVSPEFGSPFQVFANGGKNRSVVEHLAEMAFHTCYFVLASAYDFQAAEKGQKLLLWRTKMTVEAQGVSMGEIMGPLISNTAPYLGRELSEAVVVTKRIDRAGRVEMGTPTVIEGVVPSPPPDRPGSR